MHHRQLQVYDGGREEKSPTASLMAGVKHDLHHYTCPIPIHELFFYQ